MVACFGFWVGMCFSVIGLCGVVVKRIPGQYTNMLTPIKDSETLGYQLGMRWQTPFAYSFWQWGTVNKAKVWDCKDKACNELIIAAMTNIKGHWAKSKKHHQSIGQLDFGFQQLLHVVVAAKRVSSGYVSTSYNQFVVSFNSCFFFPKGFWGILSNQGHCCGKYAS